MRALTIIAIFIATIFRVVGQNHPVIFDQKSGLPSNAVYDCLQGTDGLLWVTTDKGISAYDGYEFKNYGLKDGLPTLFIWRIKQDQHDRIWLENNETPFTYIKNGAIHRVGKHYPDFYLKEIIEDQNGSVFILAKNTNYTYEITPDDQIIIHDSTLHSTFNGQHFWSDSATTREAINVGKYNIERYAVYNNYRFIIKDLQEGTARLFESKVSTTKLLDFRPYSKDEIVLSHQDGFTTVLNLNTLEEKKVLTENADFFGKPIDIWFDQSRNQWIPDIEKGLILIKSLPSPIRYQAFHPLVKDEKVKSVFNLSDSSFLLSTTHRREVVSSFKGICSSNESFKTEFGPALTFQLEDYRISLNEGFCFYRNLSDPVSVYEYRDLIPAEKRKLYEASSDQLYIPTYKCFDQIDNKVFAGTGYTVFSYEIIDEKLIITSWLNDRVNAVSTDKKSIYWGNSEGLFSYTFIDQSIDTLFYGISIDQIKNSKTWVLAKLANGDLVSWNKTTETLKTFKDYPDATIYEFVQDDLWMINENDLFFFKNGDLDDPVAVAKQLPFENVKFIQMDHVGKDIYVFTEEGFYQFPTDIGDKELTIETPFFDLASVELEGKPVADPSHITVSGTQTRLRIKLKAILFPNSRDLSFAYTIGDQPWVTTQFPEIELSRIPFGVYDIRIKAFYANGDQYGKTLFIHVNNPIPYYRTWWFLSLVLLSAVIITALYLNRRNQRHLKLINLKFERAQNHQKMLMMQMKPHFLSNIFNNLQGAILAGDHRKSISYISSVDAYLRKTLKASENDLTKLEDELSLAFDYIAIEQKRVSKKLNLILPEDWDRYKARVIVPVFILQPIVENAIWHGIKQSNEDEGIIQVGLSESLNYYVIEISDNGVGIGASNVKGNSIALKNIEERLSLLDKGKRQSYLSIEKLEVGTKVKLYVTKQS